MAMNGTIVFPLSERLLRVLHHPKSHIILKSYSELKKVNDIMLQLLLLEAPLNRAKVEFSGKTLHQFIRSVASFIRACDLIMQPKVDSDVHSGYHALIFLMWRMLPLIRNLMIYCEKMYTIACQQLNARRYILGMRPKHCSSRGQHNVEKIEGNRLLDPAYVVAHDNIQRVRCPHDSFQYHSFPHSPDSSQYFSFSQSPDSSEYISFSQSPDSSQSQYISLPYSLDSSHNLIIEVGDQDDEGSSLLQSQDSFQSPSRTSKKACCGLLTKLKWVPIVSNVAVESCQASLTQVKEEGKIRHQIYLTLGIIFSCFCLIMSLAEASHNWVSHRRQGGSRVYFHGAQMRLLETFFLGFGIVCSTLQLLLGVSAIVTKKDVIKFDIVPLLLSIFYMVAVIIYSRQKSLSGAKCRIHGHEAVQFRLLHGRHWVPECPQCLDNAV